MRSDFYGALKCRPLSHFHRFLWARGVTGATNKAKHLKRPRAERSFFGNMLIISIRFAYGRDSFVARQIRH